MLVVLAAGTLGFLFSLPSLASADWSIPQTLSASGRDIQDPQVAIGSDGTATVVWDSDDGSDWIIQERQIAADGTPAATINDLSISDQSAFNSQVAVGPDGRATVVWERFDGSDWIIQERQIAPDGTPAATTNNLSASSQDAQGPQVAIGPDGTSTVVWHRYDGSDWIIQERQIAADGTPAATTYNLSANGQDAGATQLAIGADGTATIVWESWDGSNQITQERQIAAGGPPAATTNNLSASGQSASAPQVAIGPDGRATVVWYQFDGSTELIQERQIAAGGTPAATTNNLSASGQVVDTPQVAVGPDGTATAVWQGYDGSDSFTQERQIAAGGTPASSINDLSVGGDYSFGGPQVAVGPDGIATVVWDVYNGIVQERPIAADGTPAATINDLGSGFDERVAIGSDGTATVVWRSHDDAVQASTRPAGSGDGDGGDGGGGSGGSGGSGAGGSAGGGGGKTPILELSVHGQKVVQPGTKAKETILLSNRGSAKAVGAQVCLKKTQQVKKAIVRKSLKPEKRCRTMGSVVAGGSAKSALKFKVKPTAQAGKLKLVFVATANGVEPIQAVKKPRVTSAD